MSSSLIVCRPQGITFPTSNGKIRLYVLPNQRTQPLDRQKLAVSSGVVGKALGHLGHAVPCKIGRTQGLMLRRQDSVVATKIDGVETVAGGNHFFVDLLSWPNANHGVLTLGPNGLGDIRNPIRGNLRNENFSAPRLLDGPQHHLDAFLQGNIEARHRWIRDGQNSSLASLEKKRNHGPPTSHDVAVTHHTEAND